MICVDGQEWNCEDICMSGLFFMHFSLTAFTRRDFLLGTDVTLGSVKEEKKFTVYIVPCTGLKIT